MALENIKLSTWEANDRVFLRVEHDMPNGSAIVAEGDSLVKALLELAERLVCTDVASNLHDSIWNEEKIVGGDND